MSKAVETVGWMLICKGSGKETATELAKSLGSISGYVDYIAVQLNAPKGKKVREDIRQVAEQYADLVYDYEWTGNFTKARNDLLGKMPKELDWLGWQDSDDTFFNPELIQPIVNKATPDISGIYVMYDYDHDEFGNVITQHWVTRIVRNNNSFTWKSSIDDEEMSVHETLVARRTVNSYGEGAIKVIHHSDEKHRQSSLLRNIDLLKGMYTRQQEKGKIDPRILYYLAIHLYDAYDFQAVKDLLREYLQLSGWAEERSMAHVYMGKIFLMEEKDQMAKTAFLLAIGEDPKNENAYLEIAAMEFQMERYESAVEFLKIGTSIEREVTPLVKFNNQYQMYALMAECLVNIGGKKISEAMKWINKALDKRPYDEVLKKSREKIQFLIDQRDDMRAANRLIRKLEKDEKDKVLPFVANLPHDLADSPPVISAYQRHAKPRKWPKKSIVIYVGNSTLGIWGPWSLNGSGIGGSEEAVIRLSNELTKLGWFVTIYGTPGERAGDYNGVIWKQYWELNPRDKFDVLISWRQPGMFDFKLQARRKYLWLHDIMPKEEFTKERIDGFDKCIFVSQYHADRPEFVDIPPEKKFVSANGITPDDFASLDGRKTRRDPHRLVYMSANERGLRILYDIWPKVRAAVPDATLDVYYGWHSFDAVNRNNPERMMWKATMQRKAKKLEGVTERGRIPQDQINKEIFKSGIWAYPSFFPEVNCITGQKAMAGGAIPVTSDYAVLKDIVKFGEAVPMGKFTEKDVEHYKDALINWMIYPERQERIRADMMKWARKEFDWVNVARQWHKEMKP